MDRYSIHLKKPSKLPKTSLEEVQEMIQKWDMGESIQTLFMGNGSMDYEIDIQIHMIEICRMALDKHSGVLFLEKTENCKMLFDALVLNKIRDISDDKFESAIKLARCFLAIGPKETMAIFKKKSLRNFNNRVTQISKKIFRAQQKEEINQFVMDVIDIPKSPMFYAREGEPPDREDTPQEVQPRSIINMTGLMDIRPSGTVGIGPESIVTTHSEIYPSIRAVPRSSYPPPADAGVDARAVSEAEMAQAAVRESSPIDEPRAGNGNGTVAPSTQYVPPGVYINLETGASIMPAHQGLSMGYMPPRGHQVTDPRQYIIQENATEISSSETQSPERLNPSEDQERPRQG